MIIKNGEIWRKESFHYDSYQANSSIKNDDYEKYNRNDFAKEQSDQELTIKEKVIKEINRFCKTTVCMIGDVHSLSFRSFSQCRFASTLLHSHELNFSCFHLLSIQQISSICNQVFCFPFYATVP